MKIITSITVLALTIELVLGRPSWERQAKVQNGSPSKVAIYWRNSETMETSLVMSLEPGEEYGINSFVGHEFVVQTEQCAESGTCANAGTFQITKDSEEQEFRVQADYSIAYATHRVPPPEPEYVVVDQPSPSEYVYEHYSEPQATPLTSCRQQAEGTLMELYTQSAPSASSVLQALDGFTSCLAENVTHTLQRIQHDLTVEEMEIRRRMAAQLENYTCADAQLPTTAPMYKTNWTHDGMTREVGVVHDRAHSKIHVLENFISPEECQAIEDAAAPILHKATVADGKGGSQYSPNRKAMQAGVRVPWHLEEQGNLIAAVSRRVLDYTNHILGLNLKEPGQEDLMSIQYFGRGTDDSEPDQYMPHCDGDCTGLKHKVGGRVATMVMYCTVPERGGSTNFRNAGVHVAPQKGAAAFFASIGSEDLIMDNGYTEHSGCPVLLGTKKIAVQWLRLGVDEENPWDSFNTLGVKECDE